METSNNSESSSFAAPESTVSSGSKPYDEQSSRPDAEPAIMLAPTTNVSPNRYRTLIEEGEKSEKTTPETARGSKDEADVEKGRQLFQNNKDYNSEDENGDTKCGRKKLVFAFGMALLICFAAGFLGDYLLRKKRNEQRFNAFAKSKTSSPTGTKAPTLAPTTSAPTITAQPSFSPTLSPAPTKAPTKSPTLSPSASPTISPNPTGSPTASPTMAFATDIQDFLFGYYGVEVFGGSKVAITNALAIEWLALEAQQFQFVELNGKLVQRFALVAADLSLQGAKTVGDAPRNAQLYIDECDWKGITCDSENWVKEIKWGYQPMGRNGSGTISPELRLLVGALTFLDLSNNELVGTIPEELYKLTKLEKLFLLKNNLEGTISTKIKDFDSITHFHLSHNNLTGRIPEELKSDEDGIRPLKYFNVYNNKLTGTLPQNMRLRNVIYFDVGRNSLTGTLPVDLGEKFVALRHLHLDHNEFRGPLPSSYNTVGNGRLESFSIDHNKLTGIIPGDRDMYHKLVQYTMHANSFDGMDSGVCRSEIPQGEMVELRADCNVCRCNGYFDLCRNQCL